MEKGIARKMQPQALCLKECVENNPLMAKLLQNRKKVALIDKRRSDPEFDLAYVKKQMREREKRFLLVAFIMRYILPAPRGGLENWRKQ